MPGELILALVVLLGLFFILPNRITVGVVGKSLFQLDYTLSYADRGTLEEMMGKRQVNKVFCSACSSAVKISFLRKLESEHLAYALCLPCFLQNHTNTSQEDIDRVVKIAEEKGWYIKE